MLVNSLGEVVSRRDFMPFGEEIFPDGTHRTTNLKYNFGDNIRQKFTGYQKDEETQLDFAEARMYQNLHGRFTAVDPLLASGKSADPQTFNRYVYVMNNPLAHTDPDGLQVATWTGPVYTDGSTYGPEPFGENSWPVKGLQARFVDATDGYSYSFSESGSMLLGRTSDLNSRAARMMPDAAERLVKSIGQPLGDAIGGIRSGSENFGKSLLNSVTEDVTGGSFRSFLGYDNPLALERTSYQNARQAAYGYTTEIAFFAWSAAATGGAASAGASGSSLSVVPNEAFAFRTVPQSTTALVETPARILKPGGQLIGSPGSSTAIREITGGMDAANSIAGRLITSGVKPVAKPRYPGTWYNLNSGGGFGVRTTMSRSPGSVCTIDCNIPGVFTGKLKF